MNMAEIRPELAYVRLRAALGLHGKAPTELSGQDRERAEKQARREYEIETRILSAPQAAGIVVSDEEIRRAVAEVRERFSDEASFLETLAHNQLDPHTLELGLARQCRVNNVLAHIEADCPAPRVSDVEIGIYYHSHFNSFRQPERREAFHILISINEDFPENSRERAHERMRGLRERLLMKPKWFESLAMKNSECPTALRGGRIGWVRRGQLYPSLDATLFSLKAGGLSDIEESDVGLHLLWCRAVRPPETLSLEAARPHILKVMKSRFREQWMREWIASLESPTEGTQDHERQRQ